MNLTEQPGDIIFGAGATGQFLYKALKKRKREIVAFADNYKSGCIGDVQIISSMSFLKKLVNANQINCIYIAARHENEEKDIERQIKEQFGIGIRIVSASEIMEELLNEDLNCSREKWNIDFDMGFKNWLSEIESEIQFWAHDFVQQGGAYYPVCVRRLQQTIFDSSLPGYDFLNPILGNNSILLDLGCGLIPMYHSKMPDGKQIVVESFDPLKYVYDRINTKYLPEYQKIRIKFGLFEFIAEFCPAEYADAIVINNALDHCIDPYKALIEALFVLKKGGRINLHHRRSESWYEYNSGLHKWNLDYDKKNHFILFNDENFTDLTMRLEDIAEVEVIPTAEKNRREQLFEVHIIKKQKFSLEDYLSLDEERKQLAIVLEHMTGFASEFMKIDYI